MSKQDQISGALIGAAIGDALGFIIEKKKTDDAAIFVEELKKDNLKTFNQRTYPREYAFGQYSDDTQFSIILMKSIIECKRIDPQDYLKKLLKENKAKNLIGLGRNTRKIFEAYAKNQDVSQLTNISSNGSLMRSWIIGFVSNDKNKLLQYSRQQSELTHNNSEAINACFVMSSLINVCLNQNVSKKEFTQEIGKLLDNKFLFLKLKEFEDYVSSEFYNPEWDLIPPGALVTLLAVLYSVYNNFDSFESAIFAGLSLGGDTDSVAALIGALMGTRLGIGKIPEKWINIPCDSHFGGYKELMELSKKFSEFIENFETNF